MQWGQKSLEIALQILILYKSIEVRYTGHQNKSKPHCTMRHSCIHSAIMSDHCAWQELYYCVKLNRIFSPATYLAGPIETENCTIEFIGSTIQCISIRYLSRFFVRVGHETMYASIGNKHFFTK